MTSSVEPAVFKVEIHHDVADLKSGLQNSLRTTDTSLRRESLKRVLRAMNQSLDVSSVFPEMVQASATSDLVQKRMVLQYLSANASLNPSLSILTVNTLLKDCEARNAHVRCMGLSSLISLQTPEILEYCESPIASALTDHDGDVRANGVDACCKAFGFIDHDSELANNFKAMIKHALHDQDTRVFIRATLALIEMSPESVAGNREVTYRLLNSLQDKLVDPILIPLLLDKILMCYNITDEEEFYDVLNILDVLLDDLNSELVCSITQVFIKLLQIYVPEEMEVHLPMLIDRVIQNLITHLGAQRIPELMLRVVEVIDELIGYLENSELSFSLLHEYIDYIMPNPDDPMYLRDAKIVLINKLICEESRAILVDKVLTALPTLMSSGDRSGNGVRQAVQLLIPLYDSSQEKLLDFGFKSLSRAHFGKVERLGFAAFADLLCHIESLGGLLSYFQRNCDVQFELAQALEWIAYNGTDHVDILALIRLLGTRTMIDEMDECPYILEALVARILPSFQFDQNNENTHLCVGGGVGLLSCEDDIIYDMDEMERKEHLKSLLLKRYAVRRSSTNVDPSSEIKYMWTLCVPLLTTCAHVLLRRAEESHHFVTALFEKILLEETVIPPNVANWAVILCQYIRDKPEELLDHLSSKKGEKLDYALFNVKVDDYPFRGNIVVPSKKGIVKTTANYSKGHDLLTTDDNLSETDIQSGNISPAATVNYGVTLMPSLMNDDAATADQRVPDLLDLSDNENFNSPSVNSETLVGNSSTTDFL